jgi:hypothetical protein
MAKPDSWEEMEEGGGGRGGSASMQKRSDPSDPTSVVAAAARAAKLNADAPDFTYNPATTAFTPLVHFPAAAVAASVPPPHVPPAASSYFYPVAAVPSQPQPYFPPAGFPPVGAPDLQPAYPTPFIPGAASSAFAPLADPTWESRQTTTTTSHDPHSEEQVKNPSSQMAETMELDVDHKKLVAAAAAEEEISPPSAEEKKHATTPSNGTTVASKTHSCNSLKPHRILIHWVSAGLIISFAETRIQQWVIFSFFEFLELQRDFCHIVACC